MKNAVSELQKKKQERGLILKITKKHSVDLSNLRKRADPRFKRHKNHKLTLEEEMIAVAIMKIWSGKQNHLMVRAIPETLAVTFPDKGPLSRDFVRGFMHRWRGELSKRTVQSTMTSRANPENFDILVQWARETEPKLLKKKVPSKAKWNLDECTAVIIENKCTVFHVHDKRAEKADQQLRAKDMSLGIVLIVQGDGETLFIGLIAKATERRSLQRAEQRRTEIRLPKDMRVKGVEPVLFFTESGWLPKKVFKVMMMMLVENWRLLNPGLHAWLVAGLGELEGVVG